MRIRLLTMTLAAAAALLFAACNKAEDRYSTAYACNFVFRADYHPTSILTRVLDNPGLFARVTVQKKSGIYHITVVPNSGDAQEDIPLTTEIENRYNYDNIGANKSLIIGCTTTSEWRAYDSQCPYCMENYAGVNFPLSWADNGQAVTCARCSRKYNLTYGASTDGHRLLEYVVRFAGGVLTVRNN